MAIFILGHWYQTASGDYRGHENLVNLMYDNGKIS